MFTFFKGEVLQILLNSIILTNDLFGIEVYTPYIFSLGDKVALYIYTNFSSDNGMSFFGFYTFDEMSFFQLLISVPGLGAKTAIKLIQNLGIKGVASAIYNKDHKLIMKIPGIGAKIANRIVTDLWEKVPTHLLESQESYDLLSTLMSIGYDKAAILKVLPQIEKTLPLEEQLRQSMILLQN